MPTCRYNTLPTYRLNNLTKTDCSNYRGISLLSTSYNILSNIILSRLIPYADEIIGDHQCGFRCNRSTTDQIFYIRKILEKKWEYNGTVHQLFIYFKKGHDSVRREAVYNILIEVGIPRKLVGLIKMCLNETYSRVRIGKNHTKSMQWDSSTTTDLSQESLHIIHRWLGETDIHHKLYSQVRCSMTKCWLIFNLDFFNVKIKGIWKCTKFLFLFHYIVCSPILLYMSNTIFKTGGFRYLKN
jgi:hypothetical protein